MLISLLHLYTQTLAKLNVLVELYLKLFSYLECLCKPFYCIQVLKILRSKFGLKMQPGFFLQIDHIFITDLQIFFTSLHRVVSRGPSGEN